MKIAHFVNHSLVRFTPGRISAYWGRYTEHEGRAFALRRSGGWMYQEPLNPQGFYCSKGESKTPLLNWVNQCEVLHFHDDSYPSGFADRYPGVNLNEKILVYQAHIGNIPMRYFSTGNRMRWDPRCAHAAITNGYGHLFDDDEKISQGRRTWGRLPDILDLDHPTYAPQPNLRSKDGPLHVVYTYSNNREDGKINAKRPKGHRRILEKISGIKFEMVSGRPFEEAMAVKKVAHIVLEEIFTPYLHLSALEGAAVGACVVTNYNKTTIAETSNAIDAPIEAWPFVRADPNNIEKVICRLRDNRGFVEEYGQRARQWMLDYYTAPQLLAKYLEFYERARKRSVVSV